MDAAELLVALESLVQRVPLHKVRVRLVQGHPDYLGPDVVGDAVTWRLHGRTLSLVSDDAREAED